MNAQIFLKTPLYKGRYGATRENELTASIIEVQGVAESRDGGLDVAVTKLRDNKGREIETPFERLFLPLAKIDYYVILD